MVALFTCSCSVVVVARVTDHGMELTLTPVANLLVLGSCARPAD